MLKINSCDGYIDVVDHEDLWRRIHESQIVPDEKGGFRPMSGAFKGLDISVDIGRKTNPKKSIGDSAALAGFKAAVPISLGHRVIEDPIKENPAHSIILGNIDKKKARIIVKNSKWVIEPNNA